MVTRRQICWSSSALAAWIGLGGVAAAIDVPLPPKSPCGVATTALGRHLRGIPGVAEPMRDDPVTYLRFCRSLGAGGVQHAVSTDLSAFRAALDELEMYYEGEAILPATLDESTDAFESSIANGAQLGARTVRAVSPSPKDSSGRRYESFTSYAQFRAWQENADAIVLKCLPIAERHKVSLALENHKDRTVDEHVGFLDRISNEYLGALVDPGNNMSFMEYPAETVALLAPYAKACSLKDMGVAPYADGFLLSEVLFDTGITDQAALFAIMRQHNPDINPITELITRNPLQVPVRTADYYSSFPDAYRSRAEAWLEMVQARQTELPQVSFLSPVEQYYREADNVRQSLDWGIGHLAG